MSAGTKLRPVSRSHPCELCDGDHKCSRGEDGVIICGRMSEAVAGFVYLGQAKGDEQFALYRREGHPILDERQRERDRHHACGNGNGKHETQFPAKDWPALARGYAEDLTPERREELAGILGLPQAVIASIPLIGYNAAEGCWTFPERSASGKIIGIIRRWPDGTKKAVADSKRGLTMPEPWDRGGALYLTEGQSNTLTMVAMGLSAIGRPSSTGGANLLAAGLENFPKDHPIIVVGDFDPKPDGKWPGKEGAIKTATELAAELKRPVSWALLPKEKDARAWANVRVRDREDLDEWSNYGTEFVAALQPTEIQPHAPEASAGYRCELVDSSAFAAGDFRPSWLVRRLLVRGQPGIIGGPKKALKLR